MPMFAEEFPGSPVRSLIAIKRNGARRSSLDLERSLEEGFRRSDIAFRAQQEIACLSLTVGGAIEIGPLALDLDVGFVDPPRPPSFAGAEVPSLFEFSNLALNPAHDRRVRQIDAALGHHLDDIPEAQLIPETPTHTEKDDLPGEMAGFDPDRSHDLRDAENGRWSVGAVQT